MIKNWTRNCIVAQNYHGKDGRVVITVAQQLLEPSSLGRAHSKPRLRETVFAEDGDGDVVGVALLSTDLRRRRAVVLE